MILHFQMGSAAHLLTPQKTILCGSDLLHRLCFAVCWSSSHLFPFPSFPSKVLQRALVEDSLYISLGVNDTSTFYVLIDYFLAQAFWGRKKMTLAKALAEVAECHPPEVAGSVCCSGLLSTWNCFCLQ